MREVLSPGYHHTGPSDRIDDFDVTYATHHETLHMLTSEGIQLEARLAVIYRPVVSELYELDTEIGPRYYDDVIGPELRSAALACTARRSVLDLTKTHENVENEVEVELRQRLRGKHVEIAAVSLESVDLPPEVALAMRKRMVAATDAARRKLEADQAWEREKVELERNVERQRLTREAQGTR
jgi:regulator of protease activity HflC (stomatin/prohibitin superfamily)